MPQIDSPARVIARNVLVVVGVVLVLYVIYLLPPGSATHVIPASAPPECSS